MPLDYIITASLALIMLAVGMSIQFSDFRAIIKRPRNYWLGLFAQIVLLPVLAFSLAFVLPIPPAFKVGIVVLSLCPGGNTSNYISYLTNANAALSISLTTTNSFIALVTIPLLSGYALDLFMSTTTSVELPLWDTIVQILLVSIIPIGIGLFLRQQWPLTTTKIERPIKMITLVLLFLTFSLLLFNDPENGGVKLTTADILLLFPVTLLFHLLSLVLGFYLPKFIGASLRNRITISIEVGLQNTALALLVTGTLLGQPEMTKPALIYAMYTFFTTLGWAVWHRSRGKKLQF